MLKLVSACQEVAGHATRHGEACDAADADGNGFLSVEIISVFQNLQVPVTPAQISALVKLMDTTVTMPLITPSLLKCSHLRQ